MKTSIKVIIVGAIFWAFTPLAQSSPSPTTATEAVFHMSGVLSVQSEVESGAVPSIYTVKNYLYSFRAMAEMNRVVASLLLPLPSGRIFAFYMFGRADLFDQMADLAGEPN